MANRKISYNPLLNMLNNDAGLMMYETHFCLLGQVKW
jgi:hypothetical protein